VTNTKKVETKNLALIPLEIAKRTSHQMKNQLKYRKLTI